MIRTLAGTDLVGMAVREMEAGAAILHGDAPSGNHHAASEAGVVALDQRHASTVGIGGAQQDGAARLRRACVELPGLGRVDAFGQ